MIILNCLKLVRVLLGCVCARRNLDISLPARWLELVNYCRPYLFLYPCIVLRVTQWRLLFNVTSMFKGIIVSNYLLTSSTLVCVMAKASKRRSAEDSTAECSTPRKAYLPPYCVMLGANGPDASQRCMFLRAYGLVLQTCVKSSAATRSRRYHPRRIFAGGSQPYPTFCSPKPTVNSCKNGLHDFVSLLVNRPKRGHGACESDGNV